MIPTIRYGMRILVVDDEPMVQFLLQQFLTDAGYEVDLANNGCEAVQYLQTCTYDLVLTDVHMPYMNGDTLVAWMRENRIPTPIVVMDSYPEAFLEKTPAEWVFAVLAKPFDLSEVRQILHQLGKVPLRR
ncbi:MAG: response regulator [Fimbriimonadales bacterium]|nr:response regulator [Fimbriimonadales bacterium]